VLDRKTCSKDTSRTLGNIIVVKKVKQREPAQCVVRVLGIFLENVWTSLGAAVVAVQS
jgi:hypothetical protein